MNTLRKHKHAVLLVALVWVGIMESFSHRRMLGPVLSDVTVGAILLLVFLIVFNRRVNRLIAFMAWATVVVVDWTPYMLPSSPEAPLRLIHHSAVLLLAGFAALVILRNIFEQGVVRVDDVLGAMCGYLLAAGAWSQLFMLIEMFSPGSFSVGPGFGASLDTWYGRIAVLNYVSLGSLTSVGSGAVVPVRPPATILITLEAVFGQFYIAVVVAQLVGARLSARLSQASQRTSPPQA
jgi:hypothetical protein